MRGFKRVIEREREGRETSERGGERRGRKEEWEGSGECLEGEKDRQAPAPSFLIFHYLLCTCILRAPPLPPALLLSLLLRRGVCARGASERRKGERRRRERGKRKKRGERGGGGGRGEGGREREREREREKFW
jgi:hypothetical protein